MQGEALWKLWALCITTIFIRSTTVLQDLMLKGNFWLCNLYISLISCLIFDFESLCKVLPICLLVLSKCYMSIVATLTHTCVDERIWLGLSLFAFTGFACSSFANQCSLRQFLEKYNVDEYKVIKIRVLFDCKLKGICPTILDTFTLANNMWHYW